MYTFFYIAASFYFGSLFTFIGLIFNEKLILEILDARNEIKKRFPKLKI